MDRQKKYIQPKFPLIPLTAPEKQLDAVLDFCTAWNGPIELDYEGKRMMLLPFEYYLGICTPEEAREIQAAIDGQTGRQMADGQRRPPLSPKEE